MPENGEWMGEMSLLGVMLLNPSCAGVWLTPSPAPCPNMPRCSPNVSGSCSSMASASMDSFRCNSKLPVPKCPSCPSMNA